MSKYNRRGGGNCATKHCRNTTARTHCNTCLSRRKRERNPMRYAFDTTRANVYRRKGRHFWALTFEEFSQYAVETEYCSRKGRTRTGYAIDCKDQTMGYFIGNIRTVPATVNNKKRRLSLSYEYDTDSGRMVATLVNNFNDKIFCSG